MDFCFGNLQKEVEQILIQIGQIFKIQSRFWMSGKLLNISVKIIKRKNPLLNHCLELEMFSKSFLLPIMGIFFGFSLDVGNIYHQINPRNENHVFIQFLLSIVCSLLLWLLFGAN